MSSERRFDNIEFKLEQHDQRFDKIESKLEQHDQRFESIECKQAEHSERLDQHTERLDRHTEILDRHTEILDQHTEILDRHTKKLDRLNEDMTFVVTTLTRLVDWSEQVEERQQRHIEMLLEQARSDSRALVESISGNRERLDEHEVRLDRLEEAS